MLLVKDFKIQITNQSGKLFARVWNSHAQFMLDGYSMPDIVKEAVQGCLEYHAARYFESTYIQEVSTDKIVYRNLPFIEFAEKVTEVDWTKRSTLVQVDGKLAYLDCEYELCHGFRVVRIVAVRFLSIAHQQN